MTTERGIGDAAGGRARLGAIVIPELLSSDAGRHFVSGALTIDQYPLDRFIRPAVILDVRWESKS